MVKLSILYNSMLEVSSNLPFILFNWTSSPFQVIAGSLVNLVTVFILILAMMLWITPFYNLNEFPEVFTVAKNLTLSAVNGTGIMDINPPYNVTVSV